MYVFDYVSFRFVLNRFVLFCFALFCFALMCSVLYIVSISYCYVPSCARDVGSPPSPPLPAF